MRRKLAFIRTTAEAKEELSLPQRYPRRLRMLFAPTRISSLCGKKPTRKFPSLDRLRVNIGSSLNKPLSFVIISKHDFEQWAAYKR